MGMLGYMGGGNNFNPLTSKTPGYVEAATGPQTSTDYQALNQKKHANDEDEDHKEDDEMMHGMLGSFVSPYMGVT